MEESLKLPSPLLMVRKIRGCEGEVAAQLALEQYGLACARAALEEAAKVCDALPIKHADIDDLAEELVHMDCATAIRNIKVGE